MSQAAFSELLRGAASPGSRLGLERVRRLLALLGRPQDSLRFVHVAGSNGKGSVSAMLHSILSAAGHRTGLFTSPHLSSYRERFVVDGEQAGWEELLPLAREALSLAGEMEDPPTEFELLTCMALAYFARQRCDMVVLEVGLGGRLDATNAIPAPEAAVITNIALEHTAVLGSTLRQIADEKAGIIKEGCPVAAYPAVPEVEQVLREACRRRGAPFLPVRPEDVRILAQGLDGQRFDWKGLSGLSIGLLGRHQAYNAAAALEAVHALIRRGWHIPEQAVRAGLERARWPARLEVLRRRPLFLLDGAHNPQCAQALAQALPPLLEGRKAVFLTGVLADKDYPGVMEHVLPLARQFICLTPPCERALPAGELAGYLRGRGARARACPQVDEGVRLALDEAGEDGAVVAFGSLYLAGPVRERLEGCFFPKIGL